jgi:hypothetical protein
VITAPPGSGILDQLIDAAKALGIMRPDGSIDPSWFEHPLERVGRVFGDDAQREALLRLLDEVLPPVPGVAPAGQRWYPLLGSPTAPSAQPISNAYLTVESRPGETFVGLAGSLAGSTAGTNPGAGALSIRLPLLRATSSTVDVVLASAAHPVNVEAHTTAGLSVTTGDPIGLEGVRVGFTLAGSDVSTTILLEGLDLDDGAGAHTVLLDPDDLGAGALNVVIALLRNRLDAAASDTTLPAPARLLAQHLPAMLGLDPTVAAVPPVPLVGGAAAIRAWFATLVDGGATAPIVSWLDHVADLLGVTATPAGDGTDANPWTISVPVAAGITLEAWCALGTAGESATPVIRAGVSVATSVTAAATVEGRATLFEVPLSGAGATRVLPALDVRVRAPANPASYLVGPNPTDAVRVRTLLGGFRWDGTRIVPALELLDVDFEGVHHDRLDLQNGQGIVNAGLAVLQSQITAALGATQQAQALLALVGLAAPPGAAGWPGALLVNIGSFAADPLREIARVHRAVLSSTSNSWSNLLASLATVIGLPAGPGAVAGSGDADDPWRVQIVVGGALQLQLAAWNSAASGADPELRVGLRLAANQAGWQVSASLEVLSFVIPASGSAQVRFAGGAHVMARIAPLPDAFEAAGVMIGATAIRLGCDWTAGAPMSGGAVVENVTVTADGTTISVPALTFPSGPAAPGNPLAGFGIGAAAAQDLARMLLARGAIAWGGMPGHALAGLLGLHRQLTGMPSTAPLVTDGANAFSNPLTSLRALLAAVLTGVDAGGLPIAAPWLTWLAALIGDGLPSRLGRLPNVQVRGRGTYEDPWALGIATGSELLVWLDPAPPGAWATAAASALGRATHPEALVDALARLAPSDPRVADVMEGRSTAALANALGVLSRHVAESDGVVPIGSQVPTGWTAGTNEAVAHHHAPSDPGVIAQVTTQLGAWSHAAVILLGPRFADADAWSALLTAAGAGTVGHVDFRDPGLEPAGVDLTVLPVAGWYTVDLRDDGATDPAPIVAQIERVVDQVRLLHGGGTVALVAHSTAAIAARDYAAAAGPTGVAGVIAITAPLLGAALEPIVDPTVADGLRAVKRLVPVGLGDAELDAALDHLTRAIDGFMPAAGAGPPVASPYPVGSFTAAADVSLGGVPGLAIGSQLAGDFIGLLAARLGALATAAAASAPVTTHAGFGWRVALGASSVAGDTVSADAALRVDIGRVRLASSPATPEPLHPASRAVVSVDLSREGGWLAGSPTSFAGLGAPLLDVRVRRVELGVSIEPDGAGEMRVAPSVAVVDGVVRGVEVVGGAAPGLPAALGAALRGACSPLPAAGGQLSRVLDALQALGVAVPDGQGGVGLANDALNAIAVDAAAYLGPRLRAALGAPGGLLDFSRLDDGSFVADLPKGLRVIITADPWQVRLMSRSDGDGMSLLRIAGAQVDLDAGVALPSLESALDLAVHAGRMNVSFSHPTARLRVEAPPWTDGIDLWPAPNATAIEQAAGSLLPRLVLSSAAGAVLERLVGPGFLVGPIDAFLAAPGSFLAGGPASGAGAGGGGSSGIDPARINAILQAVATATGTPAGPGVTLFNEVTLSVTGTDTIRIAIDKPAGGSLLPGVAIGLTVDIDRDRHVTPGGTVTVNVPLGGVSGGTPWQAVDIAIGVSADGPILTITPTGGTTIRLLPRFGGFGDLAGTGAALLPRLLDELDSRIPTSAVKTAALGVAAALDLYDSAGGFAGHQAQLAALAEPGALSALGAGAAAGAGAGPIAALLGALGVPGSVTLDGDVVAWTSAGIEVRGGWGTAGPEVLARATGVAPAGSAVRLSFTAGFADGAFDVEVIAGFDLPAGLGFPFTPSIRARLQSGALHVTVLPLGVARESELAIALSPSLVVRPAPTALARLVDAWLFPLAADLAIRSATPLLSRNLTATITLADVLRAAGLLSVGGPPFQLQSPLPTLADVPGRLLDAFSTLLGGIDVDIGGGLRVGVGSFGSRIGIHIHGALEVDAGSVLARVLFGGEQEWNGGVDRGLTLLLFEAAAGALAFNPGLHLVGLGIGLAGKEGAQLVDTAALKIAAIKTYVFADIATGGLSNLGAGVELDGVGLPLGLLGGPGQGAANPVAASLLGNPGAGSGDGRAVNPAVNASIYFRTGALGVSIDGGSSAVWIPVQRSFGPLYIDQVGVEVREGAGGPFVGVLIDGAAHVGPLLAQVDDLGVVIPVRNLHRPDRWTLDLRGLAIAFRQPPVSIAGGLVKYPGPPVEYDGMVSVQITNLGINAVGAYARPRDAEGEFTSLFIFAALSQPVGGPPYLFVTGLGGGFGYNRQLRPPEIINEVPGFFLVSAIDDNRLANDPMGALNQIGLRVPPKRGALWMAAGVRFTSFVVVNTTAVAYVTLDRGFELGVLGVSRMALPDADAAVVSVELALKARYSSEEALLSVQAQLTDNSWIFTRDCQLTGGFAFFMWFRESQFVLTLGGYHPAFQKPDRFPTVPRLGFRWRVDDNLLVKGEAYFALTNSCVMLGGKLVATFDAGAVRAWFTAYADVLIAWDPFHYSVDIGISVGVEFTAKICFFGCVRIHVSASVGADLHLEGPPLHGTVGIHYWVLDLTIPFGRAAVTRELLTWSQFRDKYLTAGDPAGTGTNAHVTSGLLPPDPPGAAAAAGSRTEPWKVGGEYAFAIDTRLAAERWVDFVSAVEHSHPSVGDLDIAPMGDRVVTTLLRLGLTTAAGGAVTIDPDRWVTSPVVSAVPEATWQFNDDVPAAARNVTAITGLGVTGVAEPRNRSALIPIATLVDDLVEASRPLPFSAAVQPSRIQALVDAGAAANAVLAISASAGTNTMRHLATLLLDDMSPATVSARQSAGLPPEPVPVFARATVRRRSAPPLVTPLAQGLTMQPVGRPEPPAVERALDAAVELDRPRLRAVLKSRPVAVPPVPPAIATHVRNVAAAKGAPRMAAPRFELMAAARLHRWPDPRAPRPTDAASATRSVRSSELGMATSGREVAEMAAIAAAVIDDGATVAAGATHVWDLPGASAGGKVTVVRTSGGARARVACLSRTGAVLADATTPADSTGPDVALPPRTATVVISCLGRGPAETASGWTSSSPLAQVGSLTLACPGGWLRVSAPADARRRGQRATTGMVRALEAVAGRSVETTLPATTGVVIVLLDLLDQPAADRGDLMISATGATLGDPIQVDSPRQRALLYDVLSVDERASSFAVAVVSMTAWQAAGTVGVAGHAAEWAARFSASTPDDLVGGATSTPDGAIVVTMTQPPAPHQPDGEDHT